MAYWRSAFAKPTDKDLVTDSAYFLAVVGVVSGLWVFAAVLGHRADAKASRDEASRKAPPMERRLSIVRDSMTRESDDADEVATRRRAARAHFLALRASMPVAVAKGSPHFWDASRKTVSLTKWSLTALAIRILREEHDWLSIWDVYDPYRPRAARCALMLFDALLVFFAAAVASWYAFQDGLCESRDDEASCENVKSYVSFGAERLCDWDEDYDDPCVFREVRGHQAFFLEAQAAFLSVAIALPLIMLLDVLARAAKGCERLNFEGPVSQGSVSHSVSELIVWTEVIISPQGLVR